MITAADGLQYEDLAQVLAGKPADTPRNIWVQRLTKEGRSERFIRAWVEAYESFDGRIGPGGGKVNSFHNAVSAIRSVEEREAEERKADTSRRVHAHVQACATLGFYDLPATPVSQAA